MPFFIDHSIYSGQLHELFGYMAKGRHEFSYLLVHWIRMVCYSNNSYSVIPKTYNQSFPFRAPATRLAVGNLPEQDVVSSSMGEG